MKKLLFILLLLIATVASAQTEYPKFSTDSTGQNLVILTLEQAQALDNSTDLLVLFEKLNGQVGDYDNACLKVVDEKNAVIASLDIQISKLKERDSYCEKQINNLQKQIAEKDRDIKNLEETVKNKDKEISLHKGEITRVRTNSLLGGALGGAGIATIIFLVLIF
jgi:peptidoglycan hydrolase CwlO-like protein